MRCKRYTIILAKVNNDGVVDDLIELSNQTLSGLLGVILQKEDNHFEYFIGVPCDNSNNNDRTLIHSNCQLISMLL